MAAAARSVGSQSSWAMISLTMVPTTSNEKWFGRERSQHMASNSRAVSAQEQQVMFDLATGFLAYRRHSDVRTVAAALGHLARAGAAVFRGEVNDAYSRFTTRSSFTPSGTGSPAMPHTPRHDNARKTHHVRRSRIRRRQAPVCISQMRALPAEAVDANEVAFRSAVRR
jgi:hypothetical protein